MNIVIFCNTYYQLITALHLKNTIYASDTVYCYLSDMSNNSFTVYEQLDKLSCFDKTFYLKIKDYAHKNRSFKQKIVELFFLTFGSKRYFKELQDIVVDQILFFNFNFFVRICFANIEHNGLKVFRFEEGILSNRTVFKCTEKMENYTNTFRSLLGKRVLDDTVDGFMSFCPTFSVFDNNILIPPISQRINKLKEQLSFIFDLNNDILSYSQKYIFFTSVYDFEGGKPVGEYDLVCKIADLVGKDNLLVKTHPRDTRTIYTDNGFNVDKNSSIPWEAIQLSGDFSDKVFMTINSGSVLSGSTMSEKPVRTYYMYKLCDISRNESCQKNARDIESLLQNKEMKDILKTVHIAEKLEDIL